MTDIISTVQYYAAPILAPVPTAIAVGSALNHSLVGIAGTNPGLAVVGAVAGAVAIEFGGGLMFSGAGRAFALRAWGALSAAVLGACMYVSVVIYSIWMGADSRPLVGSVLVTFVAYLGKGIFDFLRETKDERHEEMTILEQSEQREIERLRALKNLTNAEARKAKVGKPAEIKAKVSESFGTHTDWRHVSRGDREKIAGMTTREIMVAYVVSERTAQNWKRNSLEKEAGKA